MIHLQPFKAIRPRPDLAAEVSAPPYDVLDRAEAQRLAVGKPRSILHITRAEIDCAAEAGDYDDCVYATAKENLARFLQEGTLVKDSQPAFYIYREIMDGHAQTGLVAAVAVADYQNGAVKRHELTRKDKELDRIRHFKELNCQTEPVFFVYDAAADVTALMADWTAAHPPVYDFTADDGVRHLLWVVDEAAATVAILKRFEQIDALYIADGHHRTASAAAVGEGRSDAAMMAVIFPADELTIMAYNRVVADLNGLSPEELLQKLAADFEIRADVQETEVQDKHEFLMILQGRRYMLKAKPALYCNDDAVANLDAAILQMRVLSPLLGIEDPRTDPRIDFIGGIRGYDEVARRSTGGVGFILCPVTMAEIMNISDRGEIMFPKSTWFEPKLRSGLFLREFS